jgi:hypothetical protein
MHLNSYLNVLHAVSDDKIHAASATTVALSCSYLGAGTRDGFETTKDVPKPGKAGEESSKKWTGRVVAIVLAIASATGGAILAGFAKEIETYVSEPLKPVVCQLSDSIKCNPSPTSFTILVAAFQNDKAIKTEPCKKRLCRRCGVLMQ